MPDGRARAGRMKPRPTGSTDPRAAARLQQLVQMIGAVVAPLTLVSALMFYIGWMRTKVVFQYFGVDVALLRFSNQDYVLRSVEGLWVPLVGLLVVGICALTVHSSVRRRLADGDGVGRTRSAARIATWSGLAVAASGAVEIVAPDTLPLPTLVYPLLLGGGVALAAYGCWLWRGAVGAVDGQRVVLTRPPVAMTTLVGLLVVSALFWAAGEYAIGVGNGLAARFAGSLDQRPAVTLFSEKRLLLGSEEAVEYRLAAGRDDPDTRFRFRYTGLRLFSVSDDRMVLLPDRWNDGRGRAILLFLDAGIRIELEPGQVT